MDTIILKKRLSTFKSSTTGQIRRVSDEVILDVLHAWEEWPGKSVDFYRELGLSKQQLANLIKKGKTLVKSGLVTDSEFKEIKLKPPSPSFCPNSITMRWAKGQVIRFPDVDHLVDFLKKVS